MTEFRTQLNSLTTYVVANGRIVTVKFTDRVGSDMYGVYNTNNPAVVEALKKSPLYGKMFELTPSAKQPQEEKVVPYRAIYEDVKNTQAARKVLVEEYDVDSATINSKTDALRAARELNISFPNL